MSNFTTDCGRFKGEILMKTANPISPYATLGVNITDNQNFEQWGNYVQISHELSDMDHPEFVDYAVEHLKENVFQSMEINWTKQLGRFLPRGVGAQLH